MFRKGSLKSEVYLTPAQLAVRYNNLISIRTLANWRSAGDGPEYLKIGGRVVYTLSSVLKWESTRRIIRALASFLGLKIVSCQVKWWEILATPFY